MHAVVFVSFISCMQLLQCNFFYYLPDSENCNEIACEHGGTCKEVDPGFHCQCKDGYVGALCEIGKKFAV